MPFRISNLQKYLILHDLYKSFRFNDLQTSNRIRIEPNSSCNLVAACTFYCKSLQTLHLAALLVMRYYPHTRIHRVLVEFSAISDDYVLCYQFVTQFSPDFRYFLRNGHENSEKFGRPTMRRERLTLKMRLNWLLML